MEQMCYVYTWLYPWFLMVLVGPTWVCFLECVVTKKLCVNAPSDDTTSYLIGPLKFLCPQCIGFGHDDISKNQKEKEHFSKLLQKKRKKPCDRITLAKSHRFTLSRGMSTLKACHC